VLGLKEAEMRLIGCDLHAAKQTIAMLDADTGEIVINGYECGRASSSDQYDTDL
jgi:hypothetical protein